MQRQRTYRVSEVAQTTGISVRTLHYYDEIRLLIPKERSGAGYRLYDDDDLLRLQQILIGRDQGLALEEIRRSLDDPRFDRRRALLAQRQKLAEGAQKTTQMIRAIDAALEILEGHSGEETDMQQIFGGFDPSKYEAEVEARWGHTDSFKESVKRTKSHTPEDWKQIQAEQGSIYADAFALLQAGLAPDSVEAMDIAERHRLSIDRWFYPCSFAIHAGLADGYESDARFAENIDKFGQGLTPFLSAAMRANARRHGGYPTTSHWPQPLASHR
jgi:MerR family transcriptional regulator, thiopeptide resistance regulator